jgi:hypothetical protein
VSAAAVGQPVSQLGQLVELAPHQQGRGQAFWQRQRPKEPSSGWGTLRHERAVPALWAWPVG